MKATTSLLRFFALLPAVALTHCRQGSPSRQATVASVAESTAARQVSNPSSQPATADDTLAEFMVRAAWFGSTRDSLMRAFGAPAHVLAKPIVNPDDKAVVDTAIALVYDSARFDFYIRTSDHTDIFSTADISGARYLQNAQLHLGDTVPLVRRLFGDTTTAPQSYIVYTCAECPVSSTHAEFWFVAGRLTRVLWQHGID